MSMASVQPMQWFAATVVGLLLLAGAVWLFRRQRVRGGGKFNSSLLAEGLSSNDISKNNLALTEVKGKAGLEDTSLFCDIVQRDGRVFRVQKAKLDRYEVPMGANEVAVFVALKELDPFEEKVWYLVEERAGSLQVLGLASQTHPGLIHAFEIIGRAGKQAGASLNSADLALLKNFGWNVQDVPLFSSRDGKQG